MEIRLHCTVFAVWILGTLAGYGQEKIHTVKPNETLGGIAATYGVKSQDLVSYNALKNPDALAVGQELKIPAKAGAARSYTVRDGDTLDKIANRFGVSSRDLIALNDLANPDALAVGQKLLLPSADASASSVSPSGAAAHGILDPKLRRSLEAIKVNASMWRYIVIHHSGTRQGSAAGMDAYHRRERRMENGLAYHFVIGNGRGMGDGAIEIGNRWKRQIKGGHLASEALNAKSIGICLVGNFNERKPTTRQMQSLDALLRYLLPRCKLGLSAIRTHRQINTKPTLCPGSRFPSQEMLSRLK